MTQNRLQAVWKPYLLRPFPSSLKKFSDTSTFFFRLCNDVTVRAISCAFSKSISWFTVTMVPSMKSLTITDGCIFTASASSRIVIFSKCDLFYFWFLLFLFPAEELALKSLRNSGEISSSLPDLVCYVLAPEFLSNFFFLILFSLSRSSLAVLGCLSQSGVNIASLSLLALLFLCPPRLLPPNPPLLESCLPFPAPVGLPDHPAADLLPDLLIGRPLPSPRRAGLAFSLWSCRASFRHVPDPVLRLYYCRSENLPLHRGNHLLCYHARGRRDYLFHRGCSDGSDFCYYCIRTVPVAVVLQNYSVQERQPWVLCRCSLTSSAGFCAA